MIIIVTMNIMIRELDENIHRRFKLLCTIKNVSMNKKIKELIQEYVEQQEKERKQSTFDL